MILNNHLDEKLKQGYICFVRHTTSAGIFEEPLMLKLIQGLGLVVYNPVFAEPKVVDKLNIIQFYVTKDESLIEEHKSIVESYKTTVANFKNINAEVLSQLFFRIDLISDEEKRIKSLKYFDLLSGVTLNINNYIGFIKNEPKMIDLFRESWKQKIMDKYNQVLSSIDTEIDSATDDTVKQELTSIRNIVINLPTEIQNSLNAKCSYEDISGYWPVLLQPAIEM